MWALIQPEELQFTIIKKKHSKTISHDPNEIIFKIDKTLLEITNHLKSIRNYAFKHMTSKYIQQQKS